MAINPTQRATAVIIINPSILMMGKNMQMARPLSSTQAMSIPIISCVNFFDIGIRVAVNKTNTAKVIKKIPTSIKGPIVLSWNSPANISGISTKRIPVVPELMALISNTFFSSIVLSFCLSKIRQVSRIAG